MGDGSYREAKGGVVASVAIATVLFLGGCGGSDSSNVNGSGARTEPASTAAEPPPSTPEPPSSTPKPQQSIPGIPISTGTPGNGGRVLVSDVGLTLYLFEKDKRNSGKSACYGRCQTTWGPYVSFGKVEAGRYVRQSLLGTIKRKDGLLQVTYAGWPLYINETEPIDSVEAASTESFGGVWHPVRPDGEPDTKVSR
jgi:predicted lipoprotein with Yx(FWY)xxD motif